MALTLATIGPLGFLVAAVVDDLCFRKFHNWLFLSLLVVGSLLVGVYDLATPYQAVGGFFVGGFLMLPLVLVGAIGAGDMKFMMCFGVLMGTIVIFEIFVYALFWGALIGLLQSLLSGKISKLISNLSLMRLKVKPNEVQKIPYTVAIFFGWLCHQSIGGFL